MVSIPHPLQETGLRQQETVLKVAVIGAGYWGPNLARNFKASPAWELCGIVDMDEARALQVAGPLGDVPVFTSLAELLEKTDIDAVAIATPARTHHGVAMAALRAGKHVVVEKPLAANWQQGVEMVEFAEAAGLTLMADHTYCYTPAALKIRELIAAGELGDVLFIDSVRINLGLIQPDVDVFWDLAPHDLSVIGVDNHDLAELFGLTTVEQRPHEQGQLAVAMLLRAIRGQEPAQAHELGHRLIVRSSTTRPAQ